MKPGLASAAESRFHLPFLLSGCCLLATAASSFAASYVPSLLTPPAPVREFRGVWLATVNNLNWPSRPGLSSAQQQAELIALLDRAAQLQLNAVLFQVRPACDAFYASRLEPWSEYLTGAQGRAPSPFYDPLALAVAEAHRRGLELHAWFNPYRVRHASAKGAVAPDHVSRRRPELVRRYGPQLWLDPGEPAVQDYSLSVVLDVVRRYDVDGIHFDDYFYPYKEKDAAGNELDFPDEASWRRYGARTGLSRDDWRRENVNAFLRRVSQSVHAAKPWVKFGISPFGIWRPGNPPSVQGFDAYANLYADSRKWLANGWLDYCAPQLYWAVGAKEQSFPALLKWWTGQNPLGRHLWPGLNDAKVGGGPAGWPASEIVNQIRLTRRQPGAGGVIHWSMSSLMTARGGLAEALAREVYAQPALVPASPWRGNAAPGRPVLTLSGAPGRIRARWRRDPAGDVVRLWLLQTKTRGVWATEIFPATASGGVLIGRVPDVVAVTAVGRTGLTGAPAVLARKGD